MAQAQWGGFQWGGAQWPADPGTDFYRIAGEEIHTLVSETRTWQTLSLTFRVTKGVLDNRLAFLRDTAGKFGVISNADGTFRTLDRSPSGGLVTVQPPGTRTPPRTERDWLVGSYDQRRLEQIEGAYEVSVSFVAKGNREPDGDATSETRASNEWGFQFRSAEITTPRVRYDFSEGTDTSADTVELSLILDGQQAKVLEESASRLDSVSPIEVPDGQNSYSDDSPGEKNSVVVTPPDGTDPIPDGQYATVDWSVSWLSNRGYRVGLTLSPTDLARSGYGWAQWGGYQFGQL